MNEVQGAGGKWQVTDRASLVTRHSSPLTRYSLLVIILLVAAAFRLIALNDVPPGLHHDEVIIGQEAKDVLSGHFSIYFTGGYGQEPLYHYFTAGVFAFIGSTAFALRLSSAFIALIGLAITYKFTRKLFSPVVAIGTLAWMSISLWPIFFSRVGLRGILLPVFTMLAAYFLWRALNAPRSTHYVLAGAFLGLSIYTYQASRVFPIIFVIFIIYLFITRSTLITNHSLRSFGILFTAAVVIAAPLIIYLTAIDPSAEQRIGDLSGPLNKLMSGDPSEVVQSTVNTLGMFTVRGDAVPIYNVSDRPVFPEPIGAALFYLGLIICVWRWKQPQYALMLIWFFISLAPAMITPFSPNFVRTIASWPTPFVFVGIGTKAVFQVASSKFQVAGQRTHLVTLSPSHLVTAVFAVALIYNAVSTARDYFINWPTGDYVRFWQQATWTQAVRALNADPSNEEVAASGLSINDFDPQTFDLLGLRSDIKVKWFDCRNAILFPMGQTVRYLIPAYLPCDKGLWSTALPGIKLLDQPHWPDNSESTYALYEIKRPAWLDVEPAYRFPPIYIGDEHFEVGKPLEPITTSVVFDGLRFGGWYIPHSPKAGETLLLTTGWTFTRPITLPLKIFIHVTTSDGKIVAQWDGLDVNTSALEAGDFFIQQNPITFPPDAPIGPYRISLGVYHPDSGARLKATIGDRSTDSIVLVTLTLVK
jgi:4-amino-4-deoxy-L-arabinose transferase-like glycosyltransferase